jgi:hypothetical protein
MPESAIWLDSLPSSLPEVQLEKHNHEISKICSRARLLLEQITSADLSKRELLQLVKEMHALDRTAVTWRTTSSHWSFQMRPRSSVADAGFDVTHLPEMLQLHRDVWIAYEWNYHRAARLTLHEQLIRCLEAAASPADDADATADLELLKAASVGIVRQLCEDVLSTVPQMLADVDNQGNPMDDVGEKGRGLGAYFLLWPIKLIKRCPWATESQRTKGAVVFERIREYTGMKAALGDLSCI